MVSLLVAVGAGGMGVVAVGAEEPIPPFDGVMSFPDIQGPEGPEEFSWKVKLGEEEELREIDGSHAGVYSTDPEEHLLMTITAGAAHDAEGATVPTTLAVTQPDIITLTVHHSAGNHAAGGAPFVYPVVAGPGWDGGFQQTIVEMGPSTELTPAAAVLRCTVPSLSGLSLKAAKRRLRRAGCGLGEVRGERLRGARVVRQFRKAGRSLPLGTLVGVKLLTPEPGAPERK